MIKGSGNQTPCRHDSQDVLDEILEKVRTLPTSDIRDRDRIVPLIAEAFAKRESTLIFCSSRRQCENCAELIADVLPSALPIYASGDIETLNDVAKRTAMVHKLQVLLFYVPFMDVKFLMSSVSTVVVILKQKCQSACTFNARIYLASRCFSDIYHCSSN